ncbi:MAG: class IV adenylate cyclase [Armatimonadetes bacterium]|nr:class IV adenylate cyclase [Armatimonadota bacterium]
MELAAVRNLETKARASQGLDVLRQRLEALGASHQWTCEQVDTFFRTPHGRLKLREIRTHEALLRAELIPYLRPDTPGVRESQFVVLPVTRPDLTLDVFGQLLGVAATVIKTRELWLLHDGQVRVHLDQVAGLGDFVEVEAVVETENPAPGGDDTLQAFRQQQGERVRDLLEYLGVDEEDLVSVAYVDLLTANDS